MGTHLKAAFQAKNEDGEWEYIPSGFEERQDYSLFAWLADIRNYNGITPIAKMRGKPNDLKGDEYSSGYWNHWLLGSEILEAADRFHPVTESGVVGNWWKPKFNEEPRGYSRHFDPERHFPADHIAVKRDNGYVAAAYAESCDYKRVDYKCSPLRVIQEGCTTRFVGKRNVRSAPERYRKKMRKYADRVGMFQYQHTWVITPRQRREEFDYLLKIVQELVKEHGEVRFLMDFC